MVLVVGEFQQISSALDSIGCDLGSDLVDDFFRFLAQIIQRLSEECNRAEGSESADEGGDGTAEENDTDG